MIVWFGVPLSVPYHTAVSGPVPSSPIPYLTVGSHEFAVGSQYSTVPCGPVAHLAVWPHTIPSALLPSGPSPYHGTARPLTMLYRPVLFVPSHTSPPCPIPCRTVRSHTALRSHDPTVPSDPKPSVTVRPITRPCRSVPYRRSTPLHTAPLHTAPSGSIPYRTVRTLTVPSSTVWRRAVPSHTAPSGPYRTSLLRRAAPPVIFLSFFWSGPVQSRAVPYRPVGSGNVRSRPVPSASMRPSPFSTRTSAPMVICPENRSLAEPRFFYCHRRRS